MARLVACVLAGLLAHVHGVLPTFDFGTCGFFAPFNIIGLVPYVAKVALEEGFLDRAVRNKSFQVRLHAANTGCDSGIASSMALPLLLGQGTANGRLYSDTTDSPPVRAIVGCTCSAVSLVVSQLCTPLKVPMVSPTSTHPSLGNKGMHPYFMRTIPPDSKQGGGLAALVNHLGLQAPLDGWGLVAVAYMEQPYAEGVANAFVEALRARGSEISVVRVVLPYMVLEDAALPEFNFTRLLVKAQEVNSMPAKPRIFLMPGAFIETTLVVRAFYEVGVLVPGSVVFLSETMCATNALTHFAGLQMTNWNLTKGTVGESAWNPSVFDYLQVPEILLGSLCLSPESVGSWGASATFAEFWTNVTCSRLTVAGLPGDTPCEDWRFADTSWFFAQPFNTFLFDATLLLFIATSDLLDAGVAPDEIRGELLRDTLFRSSFEGLGGQVAFDPNGDRDAPYIIKNVQDRAGIVQFAVGKYIGATGELILHENITFSTGDSQIPASRLPACDAGEELRGETCQSCPPGKYGPLADSTCLECPGGYYSAAHGSTLCQPCGSGASSDPGSSSCHSCPAGADTQGRVGQPQCYKCVPGRYADAGFSECRLCREGSYVDFAGATGCSSCNEHALKGSTTLFAGSSTSMECLCPDDAFLSDGGSPCQPCLAGMDCRWLTYVPAGTIEEATREALQNASSHQKSPSLLTGYYFDATFGEKVYACRPEAVCEGGVWKGANICKGKRSGFLCQTCPAGHRACGSDCVPCEIRDYAGITLLVCAFMACCCALLVASNRRAIKQNASVLALFLVLGQLVTTAQVLAAVSITSVKFGEPFSGVLRAVRLLSMDLDIVSAQCGGLEDPLAVYSLKMAVPLVAAGVLFALHALTILFRTPELSSKSGLLNSFGQVIVVLFISLALSTLSPFQCYDHPAENGERSLAQSPQVLCFRDEHRSFYAVAVASVLLYLVGLTAVVAYAVLRYPVLIAQDDVSFVRQFRFLFVRWDPRAYWFSLALLGKNLLVAGLPTLIPESSLDVCLPMLQITLLCYAALTLRCAPWRTKELNILDWGLSCGLCVITIIGGIGGAGELSSGGSIALTVIFSMLMLAILVASAKHAFERIKYHISDGHHFAVFLSHHKGGGACCARFLKILLSHRINGRVFFDSDNLNSFSGIFDAVKRSGRVLVILSGETLCRPWVVGEIVTAASNSIPMWTCWMCRQQGLEKNALQKLGGASDEAAVDLWQTLSSKDFVELYGKFEVLRPHGIALEDIKPAVEGLLKRAPIKLRLSDTEDLQAGLGTFMSTLPVHTCWANAVKKLTSEVAAPILVISDPDDPEASASARVLKLMFQEMTQKQVDVDMLLGKEEYLAVLAGSAAVSTLCIFTAGSLTSAQQLGRMALYFKVRPSGLLHAVLIGDAFSFPSDSYYRDLESSGGPWGGKKAAGFALSEAAGATVTTTKARAAIERTFKSIANFVNVPYANEAMLTVQVQSVLDKVNPPKDQDFGPRVSVRLRSSVQQPRREDASEEDEGFFI